MTKQELYSELYDALYEQLDGLIVTSYEIVLIPVPNRDCTLMFNLVEDKGWCSVEVKLDCGHNRFVLLDPAYDGDVEDLLETLMLHLHSEL